MRNPRRKTNINNANYYARGTYNAICDRCGFKMKATDMALTWDNHFVCRDTCWEPRHPQDFLRGIPDRQGVPIARPDQDNDQRTFRTAGDVTGDDL